MTNLPKKLPFVFIGTYTEHEGSQSQGIYIYRMDPLSGKLTFDNMVKGVINPSFLEIHPQRNFLYAVNEVQYSGGRTGGGVSAFSITPDKIDFLNDQFSYGTDPCYLSVEQTGQFALVANYSSGSIAMLPIQSGGRLGPAFDVIQHAGSSAHPERQTGPHVHCILPDPTNRFAIAVDLGLDKLVVYQLDLENGKLRKHTEIDVQPGAGPRHLTFHPNGQYAYLINELNSTIIGYRYDSANGAFAELQTVPALPTDFHDENVCADIHISPNGNYLYASNRGHDSLVCFFIDENTGELIYRSHTPTGGQYPRSFAIDPSGTFLLVANQKTNNVITFRIDSESGQLAKTGQKIELSMPVCLKFVYL